MGKASSVTGVRELKTHLGAYLRRVRQGATVLVTDRGEPIAELRPLGRTGSTNPALTRLIAAGVVTARSSDRIRPFRRIRMKGKSLAAAVTEGREDRV